MRVEAASLDTALDAYLADAVGYEYSQSIGRPLARLGVVRAAWAKEVDDAKAAELSSIAKDVACGCTVKECLWNTISRQARTAWPLAPLHSRAADHKVCHRGTHRCKAQHDSTNSLHRVAIAAVQKLQKPGPAFFTPSVSLTAPLSFSLSMLGLWSVADGARQTCTWRSWMPAKR